MAVSLCMLAPNSAYISIATCMREAQSFNPLTLFIILGSALSSGLVRYADENVTAFPAGDNTRS
jgi:hypothetical protein